MGAATGVIVSLANHGLHGGNQQKKFTLQDAIDHWRGGSGTTVELDANTIDWTGVKLGKIQTLKDGRRVYIVNLDLEGFSNSDDAFVHGNVTIEIDPENKGYYRVAETKSLACRCGMYDFEMQKLNTNSIMGNMKILRRNIATAMGNLVNSWSVKMISVSPINPAPVPIYHGGKEYMIQYNGNFKIGK